MSYLCVSTMSFCVTLPQIAMELCDGGSATDIYQGHPQQALKRMLILLRVERKF